MTHNSLKNKLLWRLLVPMCAVMMTSGAISYWLALSYTNRSKDRSLFEEARGLARELRLVGNKVSLDLPPAASNMLQWDGADHMFFQVRSQRSGIIAGEASMKIPDTPPIDLPPDLPYFYNDKLNGEAVRIAMIRMAGPADDTIWVRVATTINRRNTVAHNLVAAVMAPQLALILIAIFAIWSGVSANMAPLERLANSLGRRQRDETEPLTLSDIPNEIAPLIQGFNGLLLRLTEASNVQQRFIADAAHQLRTPLAALKVQIESALRERNPAAREAALQATMASVDRTARLSNQLLLLNRVEPNGVKMALDMLDLRELAFEVGSLFAAMAQHSDRDLGFIGAQGQMMIQGDRVMLGELINNLLENALLYGGPQINLRVEKDSDDARYLLSVEDNGAGISAAEKEKVFERFHRIPGSAGSGSGLGLSIVREIVRNHGADILLDTPAGGGTRIRVFFPAMI